VRGLLRRLRKIVVGADSSTASNCDDPRVILLVQLDHLGDAVLTTAMLPALRQRYPEASIEVLVGEWNRELFEAIPEVDVVHVSRLNRFTRGSRLGWMLATLWWGWELRRRKVDLAIDVRGEFPLALNLWLCGARRRLGWAAGGGGFLLTDSPRYVPGRPEVESRLALLAELGIEPPEPGEWRPVFHPPAESRQRAAQWWDYLDDRSPEEMGTGTSQQRDCSAFRPVRSEPVPISSPPRIVVHVGAGTSAKTWPDEHWRELIGWLIVRLDAQVVLVGGKSDRIIARRILGKEGCAGVADWTGQLGLVDLAAVLEQADLLVGADSGPAHLAAAVGTPVVALFSGTNRVRQWRPPGELVRVVRHRVPCSPCHRQECPLAEHPCMHGLRPERVAEAVVQLVAHCRRKGVRL